MLDIGTGSGILAIACAKMGASSILACDIDPIAIETAQINCLRNNVDRRVSLINEDIEVISKGHFDVILANLDCQVIRQKLSAFSRHLKPGGRLILSGILQKDSPRLCKPQEDQDLGLESFKTSRKRGMVLSRVATRATRVVRDGQGPSRHSAVNFPQAPQR